MTENKILLRIHNVNNDIQAKEENNMTEQKLAIPVG